MIKKIIIIAIILILIFIYHLYFKTRIDCVSAHSENGQNYPWLAHIHGGLKKIQFMEPPNAGIWSDYNDAIWKIHCAVISHNPANLVDSHMKAFVDPSTRFAKLKFSFKDGTDIELDENSGKEFYNLEAN